MSSKRKGLRYNQKRLDYKREDSATLRMKVLRSVLAVGVGFALTPWLGREALAEGNIVRSDTHTNLLVNGVANIYAEKAANGVGLNAFEHFELGNNQIANLYFKTETGTNTLHTLVNTVENQIKISGTVNAIRNNKIGGNLYFLSPKGMVVGSTGVINAGSLTMITSGKKFKNALDSLDPDAAAAAIAANNWDVDAKAKIDIHGQINTATGIDLRAAYINVTKDASATLAPSLKTGVVFANTVNTTDINKQAGNVITDSRLTASVDSNGNVVLADPNEPNNAALKGDGSIKLAASSTSRNTDTEFLGVTGYENTAAAKVEVGQGATIDALGNVDISANATISDLPAIAHFIDMSGYAKAAVQLDGAITGNNVKVDAKAQAVYTNNNHGNLMDLINNLSGPLGVTVKSNLTGTIWNILDKAGKINGKVDILNKIVNQVYMPFNLSEADATINIGSVANIKAEKIVQNGVSYGGDVKLNAASAAKSVMTVGLQPKVHAGDKDMAQYFVGGFLYDDSTSKAIINVDGIVNADKDVSMQAVAQNASSGSISVKAPQVYKVPNPRPEDPYESTMVSVGVGIVNQDTKAEINIGAQNNNASVTAANKLSVNAVSTNSISSTVAMQNFRDTAVNVAVNVVGSEGSATVNNYAHLQGGAVDISAVHTLNKFSADNTNKINTEFLGLDWILNSSKVKEGADSLRDFVRSFNQAAQEAAGDNIQAEDEGGAENVGQAPAWNDYFDLGATMTVASSANEAKVNLKPTSVITATGDLAINAHVNIADSKIVTINNFINSSENALAGVSAAVAVEFMDNTAEVNMEASNTNSITAGGSVSLTANTEQRYNRAQKLVEDLFNAFEATKQYWTSWSSQADLNKKFQNLQNIIYDIATMASADPSATFQDSPRFVAKAKAGIDILTSLTGTEGIKKALEAFFDASNYSNMHVSAGTDAKQGKDTTVMVSGAVGVQQLTNTANVNLGADTSITAGSAANVNINANAVESNVLLVGKMALVPDFTSTSGGQYGLGGNVGVQNSYTNSKVQLMNGVKIDAGSIDIGSINDVLNIGIVFGGSETSKLGITGMVSYMGGSSKAETLIDDDVTFTARKKVEKVVSEENAAATEDKVISSGAVNISADNKTNVINLVGDWNASEASSVGASLGLVSYDVRSVAEVTNQELYTDGFSKETHGPGGTAERKGSIAANGVAVNAKTDGIINTFTVAGVNSSKSQNPNAAAGGVNVAADGGQAAAAAGGAQNAQINGGAAGGQDAIVKINAVGSTSWNYVVDTTKATLDNVDITLTPAEIGEGVTSTALINDKSGFVSVEAEDASYIGAYSGAMALTKLGNNNQTAFQGALAGAVAVNDLHKTTAATIKNSGITRQSNADVAVDVLNYAHNSGAQVAAGLSLGLDVGTRRGGVAINLAGSGSANYVDSTVQAHMEKNTIAGGNTVVNNAAYDKDVQVAGGVTVEVATATASAGAAVAVNDVHNNIQAQMLNNSIGTAAQRATVVHNIAASNLNQVGTAVSVGVATGNKAYATLNAAVATNTINNTVAATIDGGSIYAEKLSDEAKDGQISLDTVENKYLVELNQASEMAIAVDANGNFVKNGVPLERAFAVHQNGQKVYKVYTLDENGVYVDASGKKLTCTILTDAEGNTTGIAYSDHLGNTVDINDVQYLAPAASGGASVPVDINALNIIQKNYFDLDGSGALLEANGTYGADRTASVAAGTEQASYTNSDITLTNQGNTIVGVALGLGVKAGNNGLAQGSGAAAVNTNTVTNSFNASVKNATIGTGASSYYESNGSLKEAALRVEAVSDTSMVSVAAGVSVGATSQDISLALAGSGAVQNINNTTLASVENTVASTDYLSIKGSSASSLVTVAGQVGVETSKKGIAAGFSWAENELANTVGAYARGITLNGIGTENAPSLALLAQNNSKAWAVSVGAGVALGYVSAEGAYAENHGINNTEAIVEAYKKADGSYQNNTITNAKKIAIKAEDNTVEKATAGTASVSLGYASLGGAAANNKIGNSADDKQKVRALLSAATITTADNGAVHVLANNNADCFTLALGAAVRAAGSGYIGVGAEGDAALTELYTSTEAGLDKVNISTTAANKALVEVAADSESSITSSADALSVSASGSGAQIGFSNSVSKLRSDADTITSIKDSSIDAEDILAKANSKNEILDVAIGLSVGVGQYAGVALAGNIASNIIDNDTQINISASTLKAHDTLAVLASSKEKLENYGGGLSVGVGTSAAGVAVGATVVTNTITSDTDALIANSDLVALGAGDGIKIAEHKSVKTSSGKTNPDPVDDYEKYELQETSATSATAKNGLVVDAQAEHVLRDISITGGVSVGSAAGVAVDATVVINSISGSTSAQIMGTDINKGRTVGELSNANVSVNAFDKTDISSHLDTLSVGAAGEGAGVGAAGAGDRNTVQRNTVAKIQGKNDNSTVLNGNNIAVDALGYSKIHISETGLAAGASATAGAAVTGSVSVNRFAGNTTALVSYVQGTVHELGVQADRLADMRTYNNAISLSGGIVGASVSVGVTDVEDTSHTNAELSKAVINADGVADSKVEVKAQNNTQLETELSADSLEISLGESWGIAVSNVNMEAQVGAKLDNASLGSAQQEFGSIAVEANNNTYSKFQNVAVAAGSVAGVGVGHGALNINTGTTAAVLDSSAFAKDINVNALEKRTVDTLMVGVGGAALYVGVNTMHTNIGTNLQDDYTYDDTQSYNTREFQTMVNGALERMNNQAESARAKTGDNSIQQGSVSINKGNAAQGGLSNTISDSNLVSSGNIQAEAKATTNTDIEMYQATVAIVNVGVPASRTTVEDKLNLNIQNATLQGKTVDINSTTDGEIKSFAGQGGVSGASYVDTTAYVKHLGKNSISIDGSTISVVNALSTAVNPLSIHALNQTKLNNGAFGMNISLLKGGRMVLEGEDSTEVAIALGKNEQISAENSFSSSKQVDGSSEQSGITILAENAAIVKDEIISNESIGGIAAGGSIVASKASGKATVNVSDKNAFTAQAVAIEALTGGTKDAYTTEAINHTVGVAAGAISVDKVRTYNSMQASTTVGAINIIKIGKTQLKPAALTIGATNATTSNAYIHSVNVGLGAASGSNIAQSHASGQAVTTVNAGTSGISAGSFNIFAANSDDILAKADGSNAGIMDISPYAGRVENTVTSATTVNLSGAFNAVEGFQAQALRKDIANFKADALSVTAFGGGDARVDSAITANTHLNANGATIVSGGDTILAAENTVELNQKDGFNKMVLGQGYGILEVSTCGIENTIDSTAHVDLNNSSITSAGSLQTKAHTEEQLQVNAYTYSVGAFEGAEVKVKNNITNDEAIELQNTSLKTSKAYQDITIATADDLKLFTYSYSESPAGAVGGANAIVNNTLTRDNSIDVLGGSSLYSSQDINLYAGKNVDGSVATLDLDAEANDFVGAIIPIPIYPSIHNNIQQHNQINLDTNSASTSVRHTNLYAAAGREMANLSAARYVGFYGSSQKGSFVTTDNGETIAGKTANNYVDINGKLVAGVANEIGITIGAEGDIVVLDDAMRACVSGAKDASELTVTVNADASTGLSKASLSFGSEDYANTLYERYNDVVALMNEYAKDDVIAEGGTVVHNDAYLGYQAEANRIKQEMLDMGLANLNESGALIPKDTLKVDYVELPELTASGGNIMVDTDSLLGSSSATMKAQGTPIITITNYTNLLTKVNTITVDDPGGKFVYNGTSITGADTAAFNSSIDALNKTKGAAFGLVEAADGQSGKIEIKGLYNGNTINYAGSFEDEKGQTQTVSGSIKPMANVQIQGNIYSKDGSVEITSAHDNIVIQGKSVQDAVAISGASVVLTATQGNITQGYTDGIVNIGVDVRSQYDALYRQVIGMENDGTYFIEQQQTTIADGSKGSGSYIAGGSVYINASDINVNGIIQSGFGDYYADISDATTQSKITKINNAYNGGAISDSVVTSGEQYKIIDGGAYWDDTAKCYKYRLDAYYNPSTQKILVQNVDASGGKIYLTGRISSTGNGKIICLDGVSDITVNNSTDYALQIGDLVTHETAGLISITDTAKNTLTQITKDKVVVQEIDAKGQTGAVISDNQYTSDYEYAPKEGLRYTWTTGKSTTTYRRYKKDFGDAGWGLWSNGISEQELAQWTVDNNPTPIESGTNKTQQRPDGQTVREGTTGGSYVQISHKDNENVVTTKESERRYSSGLWGYYKHYEVVWTSEKGTLYTYDASIQADNSIGISFIGSGNGDVNITSLNNIELTGNIGNTKLYETTTDNTTVRQEKGTVNITSQNGSLIQSGGALYGADIDLQAAKDMQNITIVAGDVVNVSAVNSMTAPSDLVQNNLALNVQSAYLAKGNVVLGNLGSVITSEAGSSVPLNASGAKSTGVTGLITLNATGSEGNISQKSGSLIVSDRIDLSTANGSIYGQKQTDGSVTALQLYAGQQPTGADTLSASVNAAAKGDIALEQLDGNLRVGRIYSAAGDVSLTISQGSVEDALPYVANNGGDADAALAKWRLLGIIEGDSSDAENAEMLAAKNFQNTSAKLGTYEAWDAYGLLYAIQDRIVNPGTSALPDTSDKDPNVIGNNITINVADSVGINSGVVKKIDTNTLLDKDEATGAYLHLDDLKALSKLDASTKVTWEKGADGHTYAVYTETIPIGVQQTTKTVTNGQGTTVVNGKLTIQSAAANSAGGATLNGDIYVQGREQKLVEDKGNPITQNKDMYVNNILTNVGEVALTSLGGIYNAANATAPLITGKSLSLSAAGGSIGTSASHITMNLFGTDKTKDGLSAIASGGIYVDQKGSNALLVRNASSGGDIYLGSDTSIFMGVVNGSNVENYIRAENDGTIVLEARNGSIGEAIYENGELKRDENQGVRILNSAASNTSHVTLHASDSVYVTGVASEDGKGAALAGPAGILNLQVDGKDAAGNALTLKNVGIYVDGELNLENNLTPGETISVHTTDTMSLDNNFSITAPDIYLGSAKNILLKSGSIETSNLVLRASGYIDQNYDNNTSSLNGYALKVSDILEVWAGSRAADECAIDLGSKFNELKKVVLQATNGNIFVGSGSSDDGALSITVANNQIVAGNILFQNYTNGARNSIIVDGSLMATGKVTILNEEADITNKGTILTKQEVLLHTLNGNIINENIITSEDSTVTLRADKGDAAAGNSDVGNIHNGLGDVFVTNVDITAAKGISLQAAGTILNVGDYLVTDVGDIEVQAVGSIANIGDYTLAKDGNITVRAGVDVGNTGRYIITENGNVTVSAGRDIANLGSYYTHKGNMSMTATKNLLNFDVMETESGNISIISTDGIIFNEGGADLLTGDGNVTLRAESKNGYYYYFDANGELNTLPAGTALSKSDEGEYVAQIGNEKHIIVKNGSVFNAGDIMALGGTITLEAVQGNLTNYDDFNTLSVATSNTTNGSYRGKDIATGNIVFSAENGHLYNNKDLESGENISLTAAQGLTNFAYNVYAGKNITLTATQGDVVNTAVLESVYGDVKLVAEHGNVINGVENQPASGDIITLGGKVIMQAGLTEKEAEDSQQAFDTTAYNVTNYGDIIAIGTMNNDAEGSGSIILKSENGNVYNYDDFNTLNNGIDIKYTYDASKHISIVTTGASYNIATSNIDILAEKGEIVNTKDYLVALGNVTLKAQEGIGSYGDVILAGGDITLSDTDGYLINFANLVSINGNIELNAAHGTVVNATKGEVVALNGNVTLNAGGDIEADHKIWLINTATGAKEELNTASHDVGDRIIITENYYLDGNDKVFLTNTLLASPNGEQIYTQVSYVDDSNNRVLIKDGITGQLEAFRAGDVVNRGDIVAQNDGTKSLADAGNVVLKSAKGNVTNYDDYKLVDGKRDSTGNAYYDYLGANGYTTGTSTTAKFNADLGSAYNDNKRFILSDSGMELTAPEGYLYNDLALVSHQDITLESGKSLTIGTNFASVEADGDVVVKSNYGGVYNNSQVISNQGSIVLDGEIGVTSGNSDSLKALNGSISAVTTYGEINIQELIAGATAAAGTHEGNVTIGTIKGDDVVLYTESASSDIIVNDIAVGDHLLLQGNSFKHTDGAGNIVSGVGTITRSSNEGTLIVDVNGVGEAGGNGTMKSDFGMQVEGDVRFTTMNVTNAKVSIGGTMSIDKLHVGGEAHFESQGYVTGVYGGGTTPYHDSSNALYYDLSDGSANTGLNMRVTADEFRAVLAEDSETIKALKTMRELKARMAQAGSAPDTFGKGDNSGWMNLYVDTPRYQRSNGLLLHIDTGYRSANQRWSAEDLSAKLVDFKPNDSFVAHYGNPAVYFGRYDLLELPAQPKSEIAYTANSGKVVLQKDNSGLRIEEKQETDQEENKNEA